MALPLGQGGTADVHLAVADGPAGFRKLVVLKVLKPALSDDPELRAMFLTEARLAARLHHPNVVQTYEVLETEGAPVIVMEYLDGQPLSQLIVRGREDGFGRAMQLRVLVDALAGLHAAHELGDFDGTPLGVVHRDISPHNLFVTVEGQAKLLDFGVAKLARSLVETEVGTIKGKLRYMSPEQIAGERLDRRADLYSAGVILWEALAGERMWKGIDEPEIRARVRCGDLPSPESIWPEVPAALARICRRALALLPADRPATALELADELEAALPALPGPLPSRRQIGAAVAELFAPERARTRAAVEQRIGRMQVEAARTTGELSSVETGGALGAGEASPPASPTAPRARTAGRRRVWAGVAALGLLAAALFVAVRLVRSPARPAAAPVTVRPTVPAAARLEQARPAPPAPSVDVTGPAVRAETPHHAKSALKHPEPKPLQSAAPAAPTPAPAKDVPARDCAHPFFIDADGIKRFRPDCM